MITFKVIVLIILQIFPTRVDKHMPKSKINNYKTHILKYDNVQHLVPVLLYPSGHTNPSSIVLTSSPLSWLRVLFSGEVKFRMSPIKRSSDWPKAYSTNLPHRSTAPSIEDTVMMNVAINWTDTQIYKTHIRLMSELRHNNYRYVSLLWYVKKCNMQTHIWLKHCS